MDRPSTLKANIMPNSGTALVTTVWRLNPAARTRSWLWKHKAAHMQSALGSEYTMARGRRPCFGCSIFTMRALCNGPCQT